MLAELDLRLLFIFSFFVTAAQLFILLHIKIRRKTYPGFGCLIAALACTLSSFLLTRIFRSNVPPLVVSLVGNVSLIISAQLIHRGIALYSDLPHRRIHSVINLMFIILVIFQEH